MSSGGPLFDVLVIGGGINGAAIARDAAGRGLSVYLAERRDYGGATSSSSTKLIHGGLRYLEHAELRLVRESLQERALLMACAPHLVQPLRFLLPLRRGQPRPAWKVRLGLWLYDRLAGAQRVALSGSLSAGEIEALPHLRRGDMTRVLHYADCQVDDARLVLETVLDARARGADVGNYREVTGVAAAEHGWVAEIRDAHARRRVNARFVVNAAGPWVERVQALVEGAPRARRLRLVRGSHIVIRQREPRMQDAWTLQVHDQRVVFVLPWRDAYLLLGTTEARHEGSLEAIRCSGAERDYLLACYNDYFRAPIGRDDVVWSFAGVRALVDDAAKPDRAVSRDYAIETLKQGAGGLLTVYGGKLTTHRRLAEKAVDRLAAMGAPAGRAWSAKVPVHGGALERDALRALAQRCPRVLDAATWRRWVYTYGSCANDIAERLRHEPAGVREIVPGLPGAELGYAVAVEDVRTAEDFLYRRTRMFLDLSDAERALVAQWIPLA